MSPPYDGLCDKHQFAELPRDTDWRISFFPGSTKKRLTNGENYPMINTRSTVNFTQKRR